MKNNFNGLSNATQNAQDMKLSAIIQQFAEEWLNENLKLEGGSVVTYSFKFDWFSPNIPIFEKHLSSFKGKPCTMLEIGTHEGRSSTWLLDNVLTNPESRLTCMDLEKQAALENNLAATGSRDKVNLHIGYSSDVLPRLPLSAFDFAYIDGSHWACDVLADAVLVFRLIRENGIIAFDDYLWDDPKFNQHGTPKPAVDAFLACYAHKLEVLEHGYQVWVRKLMQ